MDKANKTQENTSAEKDVFSVTTSSNMEVEYKMNMPVTQFEESSKKATVEDYALKPEHQGILADTIYKKLTFGRKPSNKPFAIICLAQPGAGKSGLMAYTSSQFRNAISVDIDELRAYYPKYEELGFEHPELFEAVTGKFATSMVLLLTPMLIENKHNLNFHKTRGDEQIIVDTIEPLRENGYDIILRTLSVNMIDSKLSSLERSMEKRERTGYCRWVEKDYHDKHYKGVVSLTDKFENEGLADVVQIFERGQIPARPSLIYSRIVNEGARENPAFYSQDGEFQIENYNPDIYRSAKQAIEKSRSRQIQKALDNIPARLEDLKKRSIPGGREHEFIDELEGIIRVYD